MNTDIKEFKKFHDLITNNNEYEPFYFVLNPASKDPLDGVSWKKAKCNFEKASDFMANGYNIGIAATDKDRLVIMDIDDIDRIKDNKPTLTTISRKRIGKHCFYFTNEPIAKGIFDDSAKQNIATEDYGEIRANWQYVVCAGSYVPVTDEELKKIPEADRVNAGRYTVSKPANVNTIIFAELPDAYKESLYDSRATQVKRNIDRDSKNTPVPRRASDKKSALFELSIEDVVGPQGSARFASLFHGSDTGKNTSIKNDLLHCWRHNVSHTPLTALGILAGLGGCKELGYGHNGNGCSGLDFNDGSVVYKLWAYAKKNNIIPSDDPIPTKALVWYAQQNKLCSKDDVIDGWKLSEVVYNKTIETMDKEIPSGRNCLRIQSPNKDPAQLIDDIATTDIGNAKKLIELFGDKLRYCHVWNSWLCWNGKYWERDQTGQIYRYAKDTAKILFVESESLNGELREKKRKHALSSQSATKIKAMVFLAESEPGMSILPDDLDTNKMLFNVENGTIDLITGQLHPHKKEDYITRISPVIYNKEVNSPMWLNFLDTIAKNDKDLIRYLQKIGGMMLSGEVREKALYVFHGRKDTGKSTFVETLAYVLKDYADTLSIDSLMKKQRGSIPNDLAALKGKRFVFVDEPDFGDRLSEGLVKKLTGLDTIQARFLNEEFFRFKPEFKIVISANSAPDITDKDQAIFGRIKLVPFLAQIPPEKQDKKLQEKFHAEAVGILTWLVQGCLAWQAEGMNPPKAVTIATDEYKEDMDTLSDFFNICCMKGDQYTIPHEYIYTAYKLWSAAEKRFADSKKKFTAICTDRGFERTDSIFIGKHRHRGFKGITCTDWMIQSVQSFLASPDNEFEAIGTVRTHLTPNCSPSLVASHVCEKIMCSIRSNCSCITNLCILPSVQSVQSVQDNSIITKVLNTLKEDYSIERIKDDLEDIRFDMDLKIRTFYPEFEDDDNGRARIIDTYLKSVGV